jgi:hypothetical protein
MTYTKEEARQRKNAYNRNFYAEHKEEKANYQKAYLATPEGHAIRKARDTRPEIKAKKSKYAKEYKKIPEIRKRNRELQLKRNYDLPFGEYDKMFEEQHGCCAICGRPATDFNIELHLDHNKKTGKIRKLLCFRCNSGLGIYEKHKEEFEKYLKNNPQ